jgi:hypothetical protein
MLATSSAIKVLGFHDMFRCYEMPLPIAKSSFRTIRGLSRRALPASFAELHLPRNTPVGVFIAFFAVILGFALIWRIEWLAAVGLIGAIAVALRESWKTDREELVPTQQVAAFERLNGAPERHFASGGDFN